MARKYFAKAADFNPSSLRALYGILLVSSGPCYHASLSGISLLWLPPFVALFLFSEALSLSHSIALVFSPIPAQCIRAAQEKSKGPQRTTAFGQG